MNNFQWPMVSAIAASLGVIVALIYYVRNLRNTWLSNSAKMVLEMVDSFNSPEMRQYRSRFAKALLTEHQTVNVQNDTPVLDFFEEVGYMTKRGVLDKGMVWNSLFWWLEPYYLKVRDKNNDLIKRACEDAHSSTLYQETE